MNFSSVGATPCWALSAREDCGVAVFGGCDFLVLHRRGWPRLGLRLLEESFGRLCGAGGAAGEVAEVLAHGYVALEWQSQKGDWSIAASARPVPHRAGSPDAFARPESLANRKRIQAGPVSATWCRDRLSLVVVAARNYGCRYGISRHCLSRSLGFGLARQNRHRV